MLVVVDGNTKILDMEVDLQLRSGIRSRTEDHGHQGRSGKSDRRGEEEEEEEGDVDGAVADLDRKRKERLNNEELDNL